MFSFRPETTIDQEIDVMKALGSLPQILGRFWRIYPRVLASYVYPDLRLAGGQSHPAGKNRSLVWMADFSSYADFQALEHDEFYVKTMLSFQSLIEPGSRASLQYADPLPMIEGSTSGDVRRAGAHHIVMFNVKEDVTADQYTTLESSLTGLKQILGLNNYRARFQAELSDQNIAPDSLHGDAVDYLWGTLHIFLHANGGQNIEYPLNSWKWSTLQIQNDYREQLLSQRLDRHRSLAACLGKSRRSTGSTLLPMCPAWRGACAEDGLCMAVTKSQNCPVVVGSQAFFCEDHSDLLL
eukprot:Skav204621  [mRNA]  locus=scaffold1712:222516:225149:- [translate_table: standard]